MFEDEEARVERIGSVTMTRPTSISKSGPLQHPARLSRLPSFSPQHQFFAKEPLFIGQGYRLLKLWIAAVMALAIFSWEIYHVYRGRLIAYHLCILEHNSVIAR